MGKTATGLKKTDLVQTKSGRIVSKKKSLPGKKAPWIAACQKARKELKIKGFSHQEGHSTLQEGQGALRPVSALSLRTKGGAPAPDVGLSTSVERRGHLPGST